VNVNRCDLGSRKLIVSRYMIFDLKIAPAKYVTQVRKDPESAG
jgi:hypothetical protein